MTKKLMVSLLATVLCLGLLLPGCSLLSVIKAPDAFTDILGHDAEGELTLLAALGVLDEADGVGGPANPDGTISRAEFVELIITAWGKANMAGALAGLRPNFADEVPAQYWGYVNVADYMGVLNGFEDATFRADDPLTYADAITMLVRVVSGHAAQVTPIAPWPYDYIFYGVDNGFNGDVDVSFAGVPCTFGDAARMVVAALQINQLNPQGAVVDDSAILYDKVDDGEHEGNLYHGVLLAGDINTITLEAGDGVPTSLTIYYPDFDKGGLFTVAIDGPVHLVGALDDVSGAESLNGLEVILVTNDEDEVIFIEKVAEVNVVTGVYQDLETDFVLVPSSAALPETSEAEDDLLILADGTEIPIRPLEEDQDPAWVLINRYGLFHSLLPELEYLWEGEGAPFLPPELVVFLDDAGYAVSILATTFTNPTWVYEMNPSGIDASGQEYDTDLVLWSIFDLSGSVQVAKTCSVTLNGEAADRDELADYDVVSIAPVFDEWALEWGFYAIEEAPEVPELEPYLVRVHREVVEGTVTATAIHYPGEVLEATIEFADETTATYTVNPYGGIGFDYPPPGISGLTEVVRYGLDFDGDIFVPIGYETLTPYALLLSYTEYGDGRMQATFDVKGETVTYALSDSEIDGEYVGELVGEILYLEVNSGTGEVICEHSYIVLWDDTEYEVLAVDAAGGSLTLDCPWVCHAIHFVSEAAIGTDIVVYELTDSGELVYVGLAAVEVGDSLPGAWCSEPSDPVFVIVDPSYWE